MDYSDLLNYRAQLTTITREDGENKGSPKCFLERGTMQAPIQAGATAKPFSIYPRLSHSWTGNLAPNHTQRAAPCVTMAPSSLQALALSRAQARGPGTWSHLCASPSNGITKFGDPPAEGTLWGPGEDPLPDYKCPCARCHPVSSSPWQGPQVRWDQAGDREQGPGGRNGKPSLLQQWAWGSARSLA